MRQLVTIQKIHSITPIVGRDRVEVAKVLGWDVIIGKDSFKDNDLVCFAEIDSVFPKDGNWEELSKFKYRIKTFKVNSPSGPIYGQGYVFSLEKYKEILGPLAQVFEEGFEITDLLGVEKYESPVEYGIGDTKGSFPSLYIGKTDEPRVQSKLSVLEELKDQPYFMTMKMDGTSSTFLIAPNTDEFLVCSRSMIKKGPEESNVPCLYWKVAIDYDIETVLRKFPQYAIQGEICGSKIQGNKLKIDGQKLYIFNIFDLEKKCYLGYLEFIAVLSDMKEISNKIESVPILRVGDNFNYNKKDLIDFSESLVYDSGFPCEGIVIRSQVEQYSQVLRDRMSFKVINPIFLTNGGD